MLFPVFTGIQMALRKGDNDPVCDKVLYPFELFLYLSFRRILACSTVAIVNELNDVAIDFFFKTDQRLNPSLKRKSEERIFLGHVFVEFTDSL